MYVMYGIWSNFVESSPKLAVRKGVTTFHSHEFFSQKQYIPVSSSCKVGTYLLLYCNAKLPTYLLSSWKCKAGCFGKTKLKENIYHWMQRMQIKSYLVEFELHIKRFKLF